MQRFELSMNTTKSENGMTPLMTAALVYSPG